MGDPLRDRQALEVLVSSGQVIELSEEIGTFARLAGSVESDFAALDGVAPPPGWRATPVRGRLTFGDDGQGDGTVAGHLETALPAVCQRCLEPFRWPLRTTFDLRFTRAEAGGGDWQTDDREVWELAGPDIQPLDLADELLVLALPLAPRHPETTACGDDAVAPAPEQDVTRPFADLRSQMDAPDKE